MVYHNTISTQSLAVLDCCSTRSKYFIQCNGQLIADTTSKPAYCTSIATNDQPFVPCSSAELLYAKDLALSDEAAPKHRSTAQFFDSLTKYFELAGIARVISRMWQLVAWSNAVLLPDAWRNWMSWCIGLAEVCCLIVLLSG